MPSQTGIKLLAIGSNTGGNCAYMQVLKHLETGLLVFSFCGEQHPDICKEPGQPEGGVHRPYKAGQTTALHYTVSFFDSSLWIWPVLNATS